MAGKTDHPSLTRLLAAARRLDPPLRLRKDVGDALGESSQTMTNWGKRGVALAGANKAQQVLGISAQWILTAEGPEQVAPLKGSGSVRFSGKGTVHDASQPVQLDDQTMAQAVELLYLVADTRPTDPAYQRPTWAMIKIAAKGIRRAGGDARKALPEIVSELAEEIANVARPDSPEDPGA